MDFDIARCLVRLRECQDCMARGWTAVGKIGPVEPAVKYGADTRLYIFYILEAEHTEGSFHNVTAHVSQCTCAVVPPAPPVERSDVVDIVSVWGGTQPKVPI